MSQFFKKKLPIILSLFIIFTVSAALSSSPFFVQLYEFNHGGGDKRDVYFSGIFSFVIFILLGAIAAIKLLLFKKVDGWSKFFAVILFFGLLFSAIFIFFLLFYMIFNSEIVPNFKTSHIIFSLIAAFFSSFFLDALGQSYE